MVRVVAVGWGFDSNPRGIWGSNTHNMGFGRGFRYGWELYFYIQTLGRFWIPEIDSSYQFLVNQTDLKGMKKRRKNGTKVK